MISTVLIWAADGDSKVTRKVAQDLITRICGQTSDSDFVQVISAFDIPRVKFDSIRRAFYVDPQQAHLFGEAQVRLANECHNFH